VLLSLSLGLPNARGAAGVTEESPASQNGVLEIPDNVQFPPEFPRVAVAAPLLRIAILENVTSVRLTADAGVIVNDGLPLSMPVEVAIDQGEWVIRGLNPGPRVVTEGRISIRPAQSNGLLSVNGKAYDGGVSIRKSAGGLLVVNEIGVEEYLRGVVPSEMPAAWPVEALKAQAVISRTYALYQKEQRATHDYDLASTVLDQVYSGAGVGDSRTSEAIEKTRGEVLTYEGELALTFFHSTSAGQTENAADHWDVSFPYLVGASCPLDQASPYYRWERRFAREEVARRIRAYGYRVGDLVAIRPVQWSQAGRLLKIRVVHDEGDLVLHGDHFRQAIGYRDLPSTRFTVDRFGKEITISGMGYGHGVGLCQWGARALAELGWSYDQLLRHYYPGAHVAPSFGKAE
jgi:stage II sporulation protein D